MLMEKQKLAFTRDLATKDNFRRERCHCPAVNIPIETTLFKIIEKIYVNERKVSSLP